MCQPSRLLNKRLLKVHLKNDLLHLQSGNYSELYIENILDGIAKTQESLADFGAGVYILLSQTDVLTPIKT
jgi:hypothetical protein